MTHATAQTDQAVVATDEINVRTGPGLSYGIAAVVKRGEVIPFSLNKENGCRSNYQTDKKAGSSHG